MVNTTIQADRPIEVQGLEQRCCVHTCAIKCWCVSAHGRLVTISQVRAAAWLEASTELLADKLDV